MTPPVPVLLSTSSVFPEPTSAAFELAAPGCDPTRRQSALVDLSTVLEDSSSTLHELAAWSALARGDHETARDLFARSLGEFGQGKTIAAEATTASNHDAM